MIVFQHQLAGRNSPEKFPSDIDFSMPAYPIYRRLNDLKEIFLPSRYSRAEI